MFLYQPGQNETRMPFSLFCGQNSISSIHQLNKNEFAYIQLEMIKPVTQVKPLNTLEPWLFLSLHCNLQKELLLNKHPPITIGLKVCQRFCNTMLGKIRSSWSGFSGMDQVIPTKEVSHLTMPLYLSPLSTCQLSPSPPKHISTAIITPTSPPNAFILRLIWKVFLNTTFIQILSWMFHLHDTRQTASSVRHILIKI